MIKSWRTQFQLCLLCLLTVLAACGGSDSTNPGGGQGQGSGDLTLTILDAETSAPVGGVSVSVYERDNQTIAQTAATDANGVARFSGVGFDNRATVTMILESDQAINISTYVDIELKAQTFYLSPPVDSAASCTSVAEVSNVVFPGLIDQTATKVALETAGSNFAGAVDSSQGSDYQFATTEICQNDLNDDGTLSIIARALNDLNQLVSYSAAYDLPVSNAITAQAAPALAPISIPWQRTTASASDYIFVDGIRGSNQYSLAVLSSQNQTSGDIAVPDQLAMSAYQVSMSDNFSGGAGPYCSSLRGYDQLPAQLSFSAFSFGVDANGFSLDAATQTISAMTDGTGNKSADYMTALLSATSPKPVEWSISAPSTYGPGESPLPVTDLPAEYAAVSSTIDPTDVKVSLTDLLQIQDYDAYVNLLSQGPDALNQLSPSNGDADTCNYGY